MNQWISATLSRLRVSKYCQSNFLYRCILGLRCPAKALMFKWLWPWHMHPSQPRSVAAVAGLWASLLIPRCFKERSSPVRGIMSPWRQLKWTHFRDGPFKAPHTLVTSQWDCCKSIRSNHIFGFIPLYVCYLYLYIYVIYIYHYLYILYLYIYIIFI